MNLCVKKIKQSVRCEGIGRCVNGAENVEEEVGTVEGLDWN